MLREQETQAALDDIEIKNLELQVQKETLQHVCFIVVNNFTTGNKINARLINKIIFSCCVEPGISEG